MRAGSGTPESVRRYLSSTLSAAWVSEVGVPEGHQAAFTADAVSVMVNSVHVSSTLPAATPSLYMKTTSPGAGGLIHDVRTLPELRTFGGSSITFPAAYPQSAELPIAARNCRAVKPMLSRSPPADDAPRRSVGMTVATSRMRPRESATS